MFKVRGTCNNNEILESETNIWQVPKMTMRQIRNYYEVPAKSGVRIRASGKLGTIKGAKNEYWLKIQLDGETEIGYYHPTKEMEYLIDGKWGTQ